jgi:hypothetical protein
MNRHAHITVGACIILTIALGMRPGAMAASTDFESFPSYPPIAVGTPLDNQYGSLGFYFDYHLPNNVPRIGALSSYPNFSHLGTYFAVGPDFGQEFQDSDFRVKFIAGQTRVQLIGGTSCASGTGTLTAYDGSTPPLQVGTPSTLPIALGAAPTYFVVQIATPDIKEIRFRVFGPGNIPCSESIDDLYTEGAPPPPPEIPIDIALTSPSPGASDYNATALTAVGTVAGSKLLSVTVNLISFDAAPGAPTSGPVNAPLSQQDGTGIPFSQILRAAGQLAMGRYAVVATVKNAFGEERTASVEITNTPSGFVPDPALGSFRFAIPAGLCQMVYYQNGALAYFAGNGAGSSQIAVPLAIAEKWRTVNSPILGSTRTLGCPVAAAQSVTTWTVQDFERGRIYAPSTGTPTWVPAILTAAIREVAHGVGGIAGEFRQVGWPAIDPQWDLFGEDPVWVFQRFATNDYGPAYWNTLEIRGRTPFLFVERIGGDAVESGLADLPSTPTSMTARTPTHPWLSFPCPKGPAGAWPTSCDMSGMFHPASAPTPVRSSAEACGSPIPWLCETHQQCEGEGDSATCPTLILFNRAWADLREEQNANHRIYQGVIKKYDVDGPSEGSHLAAYDHPLVHEACDFWNSVSGESVVGVLAVAPACTAGWIVWALSFGASGNVCVEALGNARDSLGKFCRSDWNLHTRPLPGAENWSFLSRSNVNEVMSGGELVRKFNFELEFEAQYAADDGYMSRFNPVSGDLILAHGREIADCGHCPYNAEIHPVDTLVTIRSDVPVPGTSLGPHRITEAYVWVNGFFPSELELPIRVYASPRPTMFSKLRVLTREYDYYKRYRVGPDVGPDEYGPRLVPIPGGIEMTVKAANGHLPPPETSQGQWLYYDQRDGSVAPSFIGPHFVDHWRFIWEE